MQYSVSCINLASSFPSNSDTLAFATEPVFASLANILGRYDNIPTPLPLSIKVGNVQKHTHLHTMIEDSFSQKGVFSPLLFFDVANGRF